MSIIEFITWVIATIVLVILVSSGLHHVVADQQIAYDDDGNPFILGEVLIKSSTSPITAFRMAVLPDDNILSIDMEIEEEFFNGVKLATVDEDIPINEIIETLENSGFIEWVEPNWVVALNLPEEPIYLNNKPQDHLFSKNPTIQNSIPNDPLFNLQHGLKNININTAWEKTTGSYDVVIAVIDTGVYYIHPDLVKNIWINDNENPTNEKDDDKNGYIGDYFGYDFIGNQPDPLDDHGHGTHVAGIIGAIGDNNIGITGVNWDVKMMSLRGLGSNGQGDMASLIRAIKYADTMGADIISCSWGSPSRSLALEEVIKNSNKLFVFAAGNDANDNDLKGFYPSNYQYPHTISVAATDRNDKLALFSNYGINTVEVAAPGVGIVSTYIPVYAEYASLSGTSMAAPYVSGLAGLLLSIDPTLKPSQLKHLILENADSLEVLDGKVVTGSRINVTASVNALIGSDIDNTIYPTPTPPLLEPLVELRFRLLMDKVIELIYMLVKWFGLD
jgi:subtilisin family serine protease